MEGLERGVSPLLKDATMNTAAHSATVSRDEGVCQSAAWMRRARDRVSVQRAYLPPTPASAERTLQAPHFLSSKDHRGAHLWPARLHPFPGPGVAP